jgi:hypothetical protein
MDWDLYSKELFGEFEYSEDWISNCSGYLKFLFGALPDAATAIDFGFGRGNWSLALLKLGADRVLALDISLYNVENFVNYCAKANIENIKPLLIKPSADSEEKYFPEHYLHWNYGVIQHLPFPNIFLSHLSNVKPKPMVGMIYAYERDSFRAKYIEIMRKFLCSPINIKNVLNIKSGFISRRSYQRFIDDFGAEYVNFFSEYDLRQSVKNALGNEYIIRRTISFSDWLKNKDIDFDFSAIHLIFEHESVAKNCTELYNFKLPQVDDLRLWQEFENRIKMLEFQNLELSSRIEIAINLNNILYTSDKLKSLNIIIHDFLKILESKLVS